MTIVGASTGLKSHNLRRTAQRKVVAIIVGVLRLFIGVSVSLYIFRSCACEKWTAVVRLQLGRGLYHDGYYKC